MCKGKRENADDDVVSKKSAEEQEAIDYWTEERKGNAKPLPMPSPEHPSTADGGEESDGEDDPVNPEGQEQDDGGAGR